MTLRIVDIYVTDSVSHDPVAGIVTRVYSQSGNIFYTESTTDVDGHAGFSLDPSLSPYQCRFYKFQYSFTNPLLLDVQDSDPNVFDVTTTTVTPPVPADTRLCTAFGFFRDITGRPAKNVRMNFIPKFKPALLEGSMVVAERVEAVTDEDGYAQIDLIRNGQYDCTMLGVEDYTRKISVPDQPNVNLPDLIFPVVSRIDFDPVIPTSMIAGGNDVQITPTILSSDGNVTETGEVTWSSSDSDVLAVLVAGGVLTLRPLSAGTADVRAVRSDTSIVKIPDTGIIGVPVTVIVT